MLRRLVWPGLLVLAVTAGVPTRAHAGTPADPPATSTATGASAPARDPAMLPGGGTVPDTGHGPSEERHAIDLWSMVFVFALATFIGLGVIMRVSRLLHTPLMSLTNAISAIAVVGSILVTGADYPLGIRVLGAVALFSSMTNIVSGFLLTDRMIKMFKHKDGKRS